MSARVVIAGVSTRAAAQSAAKAGFHVTAIDAFGDLDQHPSVHSVSMSRDIGRGFTAYAAARVARDVECDAVAYLSSFENHPRAVAALAAGRTLWGNPPDVLRRVRDPFLLADALARQGFSAPSIRVDPPPAPASGVWLIKPRRSGGGQHVRRWHHGPVPRGCYLQKFIDGAPASIVFVAARGEVVALGASHQLVGERAFGVSGYRYCGNILAPAGDPLLDDEVVRVMCETARMISDEFHLVGLNGIDVIVRDGVPYVIEVNPRWSSSMELVERAHGVSMFAVHAAACRDRALPAFDLLAARRRQRAIGKAIVFARDEVSVGDTRAWLDEETVGDVPRPGERISAGQPVCTVFARESDATTCRIALIARAEQIHDEVARWETVSRGKVLPAPGLATNA